MVTYVVKRWHVIAAYYTLGQLSFTGHTSRAARYTYKRWVGVDPMNSWNEKIIFPNWLSWEIWRRSQAVLRTTIRLRIIESKIPKTRIQNKNSKKYEYKIKYQKHEYKIKCQKHEYKTKYQKTRIQGKIQKHEYKRKTKNTNTIRKSNLKTNISKINEKTMKYFTRVGGNTL